MIKATTLKVTEENKRILFLLVGIVSLAIQGIILTHNLEQWVDIRIWDETMYLGKGINFFTEKPDAFWGPIYSLWYFLLSFISSDAVNLYYLNYKLMTLVPPVLLFICLSCLTKNPVLSFFYSYLFLISMINLQTWPRVSHFALIIILVALILIIKIQDKKNGLIIVSFASLLTAYVRPEFILSFLITLIIFIIWIVKKKLRVAPVLAVVVGSIIMLLVFGIPYSSGRNLVAFGQGYEKNIGLAERIENGKAKDYPEILNENFGDSNSLPEIIINDSDKFFNHIAYNIKRLPNIFLNYSELLIPTNIININYRFASLIFLLAFCSIPFIFFMAMKKGTYSDKIIFIIGVSIIFIIPPLLSLTLYFPRAHYLLLIIPFLHAYLSPIAIFAKIKNNFIETFAFTLIVLLSFIFLPEISYYFNKPTFPNRKIISYLRGLNIKNDINLLEDGGGLHYYLANNYKTIPISSKDKSFDNFLRDKKIDIVIASQRLNHDPSLRNDSTWFSFLNNPETSEFQKIIIGEEIKIYLKRRIISH